MPVDSASFAQASTTKANVPVKHVPTVSAYDSWAKVYDTDGNILQKVDDLQLESLLPEFLGLIKPENPGNNVRIVDLGCGTGRNTLKIIQRDSTYGRLVTGIDASRGMLDLADKKLSTVISSQSDTEYRLVQHDFLNQDDPNAAPILLEPAQVHDALLSTLVLEHFPLEPFFATIRSLIRPGGVVLLTNMHSEMGSISQAGFVSTDENGQAIKVRGTSWAHSVAETVDAAKRSGLHLAGEALERAVTEDMLPLLGLRGKKWVEVKVWYGMILIREE
jgi:SAM-dependent methyltransferase